MHLLYKRGLFASCLALIIDCFSLGVVVGRVIWVGSMSFCGCFFFLVCAFVEVCVLGGVLFAWFGGGLSDGFGFVWVLVRFCVCVVFCVV